jgi:L-asparaginase/Glu-tRNA(Gln) amidotransferase subunit D
MDKPKIAVFSGATTTIANSPPLVTSNSARTKYGLPLRTNPDASPARFDVLRGQRLARPVTVYVEQFSAHPLERDAAELYAPPDGYLDGNGNFQKTRQSPTDVPVYEVTLRPEDGLYPLPYMGRQANGQAWEDDGTHEFAAPERCRQPFYPDASRMFEEIDRFGIGGTGVGNLLSSRASFDFYRAVPAAGYTKGLPAVQRTDVGSGDIPPETLGVDFFPYRPFWLLHQPPRAALARATNMVQRALASGSYAGAIWLEGSPNVEETIYWLNLVIDTTLPIVGNASQQPHGGMGNDGDQNIVDAVDYIVSRVWADETGRNRVGAVAIQNKQIFAAREVQKADARAGGYTVAGGHGGIIGRISEEFPATPTVLTFIPARRHTSKSAVNFRQLPRSVIGVRREADKILPVPVEIKDAGGDLLPGAIPKVTIVKESYQYAGDAAPRNPTGEDDVLARIEKNLRTAPLAGFVGEGMSPYGILHQDMDAAMRRAVFSGMPVVKVGRGNAEGFTARIPPFLSGSNLTATKARLLLMACLMKFGSLPAAVDPGNPTQAEFEATVARLDEYQAVFDTH